MKTKVKIFTGSSNGVGIEGLEREVEWFLETNEVLLLYSSISSHQNGQVIEYTIMLIYSTS